MGILIVDKYSYLHFAIGIVTFYFGWSSCALFYVHLLFEIVENSNLGMRFINNWLTFWPGGKPSPDSIINSISDITFSLIGWWSASLI